MNEIYGVTKEARASLRGGEKKMNSNKVLWTGLTIIMAVSIVLQFLNIAAGQEVALVGGIVMIAGSIMMWADR